MKEAIAAVVPIIHIILMIIGLLMLRSRTMDEIARALWAWVVVLVPVLGPVAVFLVNPGQAGRTST
jgi:hypothetical protein